MRSTRSDDDVHERAAALVAGRSRNTDGPGRPEENGATGGARALTFGPREKMLLHGETSLSDAECLAAVLGTGRRGLRAEALALELLEAFGGLAGLANAEVREVAEHPGLGTARASAVCAAFGLARRLIASALAPGAEVRSGADAARFVRESSRRDRREAFFALLLDARHRLMSLRVVSVGGLDGAPVHPREVFRPAIREGAAALVLAHNHPSGDPSPSSTDRLVTDRLRQVGALVGIQVLDHVVVGSERYFSFAEEASFPIP
jgi:DNA repair protein RadC